MFSSTIKSGGYDVIASGSSFAFIRKTKQGYPTPTMDAAPIELEVFWDNSLLFRIIFQFVYSDVHRTNSGWISEKISDTEIIYILYNFSKDNIIDSMFLNEIATSSDGSKFFLCFSATYFHEDVYLLNYTVFHGKEDI